MHATLTPEEDMRKVQCMMVDLSIFLDYQRSMETVAWRALGINLQMNPSKIFASLKKLYVVGEETVWVDGGSSLVLTFSEEVPEPYVGLRERLEEMCTEEKGACPISASMEFVDIDRYASPSKYC